MSEPTEKNPETAQVLVARDDFDMEDYQIDRKAGGRVTWKCPTCGGYHITFHIDGEYICNSCSALVGYLLNFEGIPEGCKIKVEVRYGVE